ncbi:olfactory receptor 5AR1-like [Candoia aspera]|uniref:olfactory receptor 5AR1-like n=1 Tax=Candoia aspera TaxID=51853 RepID=UPI002FD86C1A
MDARNHTQVSEFVFLGFSGVPHGQIYLFVVFLAIYLVTIIGNTTIFTLIRLDSRLHSPMYFFLSHLSCLDVCYSTVTVPKILINFLHQRHTISYNQCMAQMFFLMTFAGSECALLAVMAFDRYAAICQPLQYSNLMSSQVCIPLALASWIWGFLDSSIHTALATNVDFCGANQIDHIFCDVPPLLKIACSDIYINEIALHLASIFMGFSPFLFILLSYTYVVSAILRIRSNTGRSKAFSTCAAHLTVVAIYFGMANVNYNRPSAGYSLEIDTLISTLYCIVNPMLNPLIYSLRNKEVKEALRKLLSGQKAEYASTQRT